MMLMPMLALISLQTPDFDKAWEQTSKAIESRYYAKTSRADELKKRLNDAAPMARKAKSRPEFEKIVNDMIDGFGDSHFDFFTEDDQGYYTMDNLTGGKLELPQIGAWFRAGKDGYTVHMVMNDSAAEKAGLVKGDIIVSADGQPFAPIASFRDKSKVHLKFRRGSREFEKDIDVTKTTATGMFLEASKRSARVIEAGGKKIGYFRLWTQAGEDFKTALSNAVYGKLIDTDAFILDLRDGFGGRPEGYADPFFRPAVTLEWKFSETMTTKQAFGYGKPLIVLINEGSRSAKEVLAYILKSSHRAILVGRNTAGHVLGTSPMRLNEWAMLEIPMVELKTDGVRLEGKGVAPDIMLEKEYDEDGKDLFLEKAISVASTKKG